MRRISRSIVARTTGFAWCTTTTASSAAGLGIAPKKDKKQRAPLGAAAAAQSAASVSAVEERLSRLSPKAEATFSTDEIAKQLDELNQIPPEQLESMREEFEAKEYQQNRVLQEDSLYQLDISTATKQNAALKVFWKQVTVTTLDGSKHGWYGVELDGRKVRAFENTQPLILPNREYALAVANEFGTQSGHINKLLMPLTDLASGAMLVKPQGIPARIDYLMSFFMNDNLYFRSEAIADRQDAAIEPIVQWFDRVFDVQSPRIVGIGHPNIRGDVVERVRQQLLDMDLNQHQIVSLCVVAQFTASLQLALAMFNGIVSIADGLAINRLEEGHNIKEHGMIHGYHDIREADVVSKVSAAVVAWQLTAGVPKAKYAAMADL